MKHTPVRKPALSEIFAAMTGLRCAGFPLVMQNVPTDHPLVDLGVRAIKTAYDAKAALMRDPQSVLPLKNKNPDFKLTPSEKGQDRTARTCLAFLAQARGEARPFAASPLVDSQHGKGGSVADVLVHIDRMLWAEEHGKGRPSTRITAAGKIVSPYKADYLPGMAPVKKGAKSVSAADALLEPVLTA